MGELVAVEDVAGVAVAHDIALATYEAQVAAGVYYDQPEQLTVKGVTPGLYFLRGLYEEYAETLEFDAPLPEYSRIGMLALNENTIEGRDALAVYRAHSGELYLHRNEFGDVLWYGTALLRSAGISLEEALGHRSNGVQAMMSGFDQRIAHTYQPTENILAHYGTQFGAFARSAADTFLRPHDIESRVRTIRTSQEFFGTISWLAQTRLDTSLAAIATANLEKLAGRTARNTIFGSGDAR